MPAGNFRSTFTWAGLGSATVLALLLLTASGEAHAARAWLHDLGDLSPSQRLWLAAFGGLSLGLAFGLMAFELRSRAIAIALRRLTDLAAGVDGRTHGKPVGRAWPPSSDACPTRYCIRRNAWLASGGRCTGASRAGTQSLPQLSTPRSNSTAKATSRR
jgi:hypothetical protein